LRLFKNVLAGNVCAKFILSHLVSRNKGDLFPCDIWDSPDLRMQTYVKREFKGRKRLYSSCTYTIISLDKSTLRSTVGFPYPRTRDDHIISYLKYEASSSIFYTYNSVHHHPIHHIRALPYFRTTTDPDAGDLQTASATLTTSLISTTSCTLTISAP